MKFIVIIMSIDAFLPYCTSPINATLRTWRIQSWKI